MENQVEPKQPEEQSKLEAPKNESSKSKLWIFIVAAVILLVILVGGVVLLARADPQDTEKVRDIFIIFMALESLVIGVALVILVIQLATLTNLLQNQIKPILDSTSETANMLKGTAKFLSDNLTEPIIKLNEYVAVIKEFGNMLNFRKKK